MTRPRRALVLSGGGARGAYEVGVLDYILRTLPRHLGHPAHLDILTGTSVGALNASWLAATADDPVAGIRSLKEVWKSLQLSELLHLPYGDLVKILSALLAGRESGKPPVGARRLGGLLNTSSIDAIVREQIPWGKIQTNMEAGHLDALSITCTAVSTGQTIVFVQTRDGVPEWTMDPRRIAVPVIIGPSHCLASAAIPLLFPAVRVGAQYYCDGALRQNTPVTPALRLGADKVLIIALRSEAESNTVEAVVDPHVYPGIVELAGKLLNGFLLDPLEYDLQLLEQFNEIHDVVEENFGSHFVNRLDKLVREVRGAGLRRVEHLLVRPSRQIADVVAEVVDGMEDGFWGAGPAASIVKRMAAGAEGAHDLLSYICFDGVYCGRLIEMGYVDAMSQHDALVEFFSDEA